jgi:proteasome assembly chaperone (PAC2) family protein
MEEKNGVICNFKPDLRSPYVVCGWNGWLNGGDVSIGGIEYLIRHLNAAKFAEIPASRYHVFQVPGVDNSRPIFKMDEGLIVETHFPKNDLYYAVNPTSDHDLIFLLGTEPNLYWEEYTDEFVDFILGFKSTRLYTLGAILDRTPYTREPKISCTCTSAKMKEEISKYAVTFSSRIGTASFNQMLLYACQKKGLDGINFTGRVPYYPEFNVAIEYNPKSIRSILLRLNNLMHLSLDLSEMDDGIKEIDGKLDFVRQKNAQFNAYIEELEKEYVEIPYQEPFDISPNEAIRFAEEFLRENKDQRQEQ